MTIPKAALEELAKRRESALKAGGDAAPDDGRMTARDRLLGLFDPQSFQELRGFARSESPDGSDRPDFTGEGVVIGVGYVGGRAVAAFSQDIRVARGSIGRAHADKIRDILDHAGRCGIPSLAFLDSGGARLDEGAGSLVGFGRLYQSQGRLSGVVPQIAVVAGTCPGPVAFVATLADFVIMVRDQAFSYVCGPDVIRDVTGDVTSADQVGGADMHGSISGEAHFVVDSDAQAQALVRRLLDFLPSNNLEDPPHRYSDSVDLGEDAGMNALAPGSPAEEIDVDAVIRRLVDGGDFLEVHADHARNLVVGFGRIGGGVVGIVANRGADKGGTIDIDAADKGARFVRFCDLFNIPLVSLIDTPGFLPGVAQERGGLARHAAKLIFAMAEASVPKVGVVMCKAYGAAYHAMGSRETGADAVLAWPTAEVALMGAEVAVSLLHRAEIEAAEDPVATAARLAAHHRDHVNSPYEAAARGVVTDVIAPSETRAAVSLALRGLLSKRVDRPARKFGNLPL